MYKESDIFPLSTDLKLLDDHIIETGQDDDVDTDEEIMESAFNECVKDLKNASRLTTNSKRPHEIELFRLRNFTIRHRAKNPHLYDRNGICRDKDSNCSESKMNEFNRLPIELRREKNSAE